MAHVAPPGVAVTKYPVIVAPPFETGAVQEIVEVAFELDVAFTAVGAPGTVEGTTAADANDAADAPLAFVAVTVNV